MTERAKELNRYFENHKEDFLGVLQALVEMETPSNEPDRFSDILSLLTKEFEKLQYRVEHIPGRETAGHLLCKPANFDPKEPTQLVIGHCDTVWDMGTIKDMPFRVEEDQVFGPGVFDMKSGLCMMIFALRAIQYLKKDLPVQPVFLINSDEEIGSEESQSLIIEEAKKASRTLVLEPALGTEGKIKTRRKGIGEFTITIKGKPSHAGLAPEEGVSAILGLSHIVQQLFRLNDPQNGVSVNVGTIEGGERTNVIAAKSKAIVDVRVPTKEDGKRIKEEIYNLKPEIEGVKLEVSGDIRRPPLEKNEANEKLWNITQSLGEELDLNLHEGVSGGASDGNLSNLYSPTIDGLGAVGEGAHAYHEKIFLTETLQRNALLTLLLLHPPVKS
ncbi:M20 family metallopeptidase [Balneolaceae bacterium YR4-1]|uniref:M20 family metallopeptidase n=1 Tax=Halalkalibaculum roseum TaxID=2709311 RepID=A0A6M1SYZ4_9BACT|nr:M20 family metallopeptidase [Halalkalibaculum roseum]NGP77548.1 M20 family metallopeptidase [Halalkalibaculum roseum]